ncbi:MAG: peptide chain release factor 3, partial [Alphaproteobacteria bacterium]|nr:peptide chain release factor 3 [Alphaproteobacteria bacterium]
PTIYYTARWVKGDTAKVKKFMDMNMSCTATDHDGEAVFLARNAWHLNKAGEDYPDLEFMKTREQSV